MGTITRFEDIEAWQLARDLCLQIFNVTSDGAFSKDFALRDQIKRASGSIMDNIAEGFERDGSTEFKQFLSIAKGSAGEVKSQLYRAMDYKYITNEQFDELYAKTTSISSKLSNLIKYLKTTQFKGTKFN
jgi:four helix bundle protein